MIFPENQLAKFRVLGIFL